jgi:DNA-binding NtrC family response regulator
VLEQKFLLLTVTDEQKVRFATQQLLGSASVWWDTFNAMQQVDHQVTWQEFTAAF